MILYSNGCSYTCNNWVIDESARYPALIAEHFGWDLLSAAIPGSCNDRILRCTIRDCIQLKKQNQEIIALVQLTHLGRTEYAGTRKSVNKWNYKTPPDTDYFQSIKPNEDFEESAVLDYMKSWVSLFNSKATNNKLRSNIVALTGFFKANNIKYYIFNGPAEIMSNESDDFLEYLASDSGVLDLTKFNMLELTGKQMHPDENGMRKIADYFIALCEQELLNGALTAS